MGIFTSQKKINKESSITLHDEWEMLIYIIGQIDDFKNLKESDRAITFDYIELGEKIVKRIGPFLQKYHNGLFGNTFKLWSPDGELDEFETKKYTYEMARTILVFNDRALKSRVHFERLDSKNSKSKKSVKSVAKTKAKKKVVKKNSTKKVKKQVAKKKLRKK
jgi:hypothetical protein